MTERIFTTSGDWALGADGLQWILYRPTRTKAPRTERDRWRAVSFVASTKTVLERCMREKGADTSSVQNLLAGLPDTFDDWKRLQNASKRQEGATVAAAAAN